MEKAASTKTLIIPKFLFNLALIFVEIQFLGYVACDCGKFFISILNAYVERVWYGVIIFSSHFCFILVNVQSIFHTKFDTKCLLIKKKNATTANTYF